MTPNEKPKGLPPRVDTPTLMTRSDRSYGLTYKLFEAAHCVTPPPAVCLPVDRKWFQGSSLKCEDAFSASIEEGKVVGDCFVFTPDGELIIDSGPSYPFSVERHLDLDHAEQLYSSLPTPVQIDGRVLVLNSFGPWNYYHWTLDIITKLDMVDLSTIDLVWTHSDCSFQREYLSAFGIGPDKIITAKRIAYWQARELVYTSAHPRRAASVDFLRSTASELFGVELQNGAHRRLYISRRDAAGRQVVSNDEVLECLRPLGFEEVVLSDLGVQEQM